MSYCNSVQSKIEELQEIILEWSIDGTKLPRNPVKLHPVMVPILVQFWLKTKPKTIKTALVCVGMVLKVLESS